MANQVATQKRFVRTTKSDRWIAGVCGGIARHFKIDPLLVRVGWIVLTLISMGIGIIAYVVLWLLAPEEA